MIDPYLCLGTLKYAVPETASEFIELLAFCEGAFDKGFGLWDYTEHKNGTISLHLATGGWSDNEAVVDAMSENIYLWHGWQQSKRGGGFWFKWNLKTFYATPAKRGDLRKEAK